MSVPIIMFHQGDAPYLWVSLRQTKIFNPGSEIIFLGDETNKRYQDIKHVMIADYFVRAKEFSKLYQHMSTNNKNFELTCMQRWFVFYEYLKKHNINHCVHLDSDLMTYCDLTQEQRHFAQYDFTLNRGQGPQSMFINSVEALGRFCDFVWEYYADPEKLKKLKAWHQDFLKKKEKGGISDMWFLLEFAKLHPQKIGETFDIHSGIYDNTIQYPDGFKLNCFGIKKIIWRQGLPYGYHLASGQWKKFNTLHFQGYTKCFIPSYASYQNPRYFFKSLPARVMLVWDAFKRAVRKMLCKK